VVRETPMEMQEIRYFLALCHSLNFRRAATKCNVTQQALSRATRKLEQELGGLLLALRVSNQTEREDWIQSLVAGGVGVCFLPEFSACVGGLRTRPLIEPRVARSVSLVSMIGRRHTPQASKFFNLTLSYDWPYGDNA